jgi:hypothetical protein
MLGNILGIVFLVGSLYLVSQLPTSKIPEKEITPWNHQPGITNSLKSNGNRDASMIIQSVRRNAISAVHRGGYRPIKETKYTTGSTSGYLEAYILSSECPCPPVCPDILDGKLSSNEICVVYDGNLRGGTYDAGNSRTLVCNVCDARPDTTLDGEMAIDEICNVVDGTLPNGMPYDAGNSQTLVCNVYDARPDTTLDGENGLAEICSTADGTLPNGMPYDAGNSRTLVCNVCDARPDTTLDGETAVDEICNVVDGTLPNGMPYDAGNSQTLVCGS